MKPLKILLGNNTLSYLAGSETWTYTLAVQLKKMGHDVRAFSPDLGIISDELEKEGIGCYDNISEKGVRAFSYVLEEDIKHEYDVIISNHNNIVQFLRSQFPITPIISTIHGILHWQENEADPNNKLMAPEHPALDAGVAEFIAVSEEVKEFLHQEYNIESTIIRNFFDTEKFKPKRKISKGKPKAILINTNYAGSRDPEVEMIREVAKHYDAKLIAIGENFSQTFNLSKAIEDADIVVGMGRSVLEGVSAGRLGIVHGRWGTGGVINPSNIEELQQRNFSGRNSEGQFYTKEQFIEEIDKYYNQKNIDWGINYIKTNHNVEIAAEDFVRMARTLLGADINKEDEDKRIPYRLAKDVAKEAKN